MIRWNWWKMVRLLLRLKWKTVAAIAAGVISTSGAVAGAMWGLGVDRANVGSELRQHDSRLAHLEGDLAEQDERIRLLESSVPRIDANVAWLRQDAERRNQP